MELTTLQHAVLETLSVQSDGYLCSPQASAFIAIGLTDPELVQSTLVELQNAGLVEYYVDEDHITVLRVEKDVDGNAVMNTDGSFKPILDEEGQIQTEVLVQQVDAGWIITEQGRGALG